MDKKLNARKALEWGKQLMVGDLLWDGRIIDIIDIHMTYVPSFVLNVIYTWPIPLSVSSKLHDAAEWVSNKLGGTSLYDRLLTFEDGTEASVFDCSMGEAK